MATQKKDIEDLIAKTIRQVGHEKDMQDIEALRAFTAEIERENELCCHAKKTEDEQCRPAVAEFRKASTTKRKKGNRIRKFLIPITSIAAVFALIFSLNIYRNNRIMDDVFATYYTPLEYNQELASRGNDATSPELMPAMNAYHRKLYKDALQKFNAAQGIDRNFLIYKAVCLIETKQLPEAIDLLKQLVNDGEGTEYWQQANWYLAISYLGNHEKEKAMQLFEEIVYSNGVYKEEAKKTIKELK